MQDMFQDKGLFWAVARGYEIQLVVINKIEGVFLCQ